MDGNNPNFSFFCTYLLTKWGKPLFLAYDVVRCYIEACRSLIYKLIKTVRDKMLQNVSLFHLTLVKATLDNYIFTVMSKHVRFIRTFHCIYFIKNAFSKM